MTKSKRAVRVLSADFTHVASDVENAGRGLVIVHVPINKSGVGAGFYVVDDEKALTLGPFRTAGTARQAALYGMNWKNVNV